MTARRLLPGLAARLVGDTAGTQRQLLRDADRVARMGGDEFAVLLTQSCDREAVDTVCRRILDAVAGPLAFGGATMQISASVGVALCPDHGVVPDVLYKAADVALYEAKRNGRNTWRWHEPASAGPPQAHCATPAELHGRKTPALLIPSRRPADRRSCGSTPDRRAVTARTEGPEPARDRPANGVASHDQPPAARSDRQNPIRLVTKRC